MLLCGPLRDNTRYRKSALYLRLQPVSYDTVCLPCFQKQHFFRHAVFHSSSVLGLCLGSSCAGLAGFRQQNNKRHSLRNAPRRFNGDCSAILLLLSPSLRRLRTWIRTGLWSTESLSVIEAVSIRVSCALVLSITILVKS